MTDLYLMTGAQSRMARSLLKWSRERLADEANVSRGTIRIFEDDQPIRESNILDIHSAFEANGVECNPDGSVRPRSDSIKDFRGFGSCDRFFANIEKMLQNKPSGLMCSIGSQHMLSKATGRAGLTNFERLQNLSNVAPVKCILTDQSIYLPGTPSFEVRVYPAPPINFITSDFTYGDEVTFALEQDSGFNLNHSVYMVLESPKFAKKVVGYFNERWQKAKPYSTSTTRRSASILGSRVVLPEGVETAERLVSSY